MQHKHRIWNIKEAPSPRELATLLVNKRFPVTQGFLLEQFLFLNDATHQSEALYAVCQQMYLYGDRMFQPVHHLQSLDFSSTSYEDCLYELEAILRRSDWSTVRIIDSIDYARLLL